MRKVVFFDRDGTLIKDKIYLNDPSGIEYLDGVFTGLKRLRDLKYEFIIVTNQSGVPRGLVQLENLNKIHQNMRADLSRQGIDILQFYFAPFSVESNHYMRKPNPGMLDYGIKDFNVDIQSSWMVGDRMSDVEAGHRAGLKSIFLHGTEDPRDSQFKMAEYDAIDFKDVCRFICDSN
jgi:histidinol-phosphate phosphatase family protein